jgi:hypothetical protein
MAIARCEAHPLTRTKLRSAIEDSRYPLSPRLAPIRAILAKIDPPKPQPEPLPWLMAGDAQGPGDGDDVL